MQDKNILLEGCIESIEEANFYADQKIDRLELCSNLNQGGLCPTNELVNHCLNKLKIPSVIMLRIRDDFVFKSEDFEYFKKRIIEYIALGAKAFIFGFIKNNQIDLEACESIIQCLSGCQYGFHMAIDTLSDYDKNLKTLQKLNFHWVLTKGGKYQAMDNIANLKSLVHQHDHRIKILVGGKITAENWVIIHEQTQATWFHGRKIK